MAISQWLHFSTSFFFDSGPYTLPELFSVIHQPSYGRMALLTSGRLKRTTVTCEIASVPVRKRDTAREDWRRFCAFSSRPPDLSDGIIDNHFDKLMIHCTIPVPFRGGWIAAGRMIVFYPMASVKISLDAHLYLTVGLTRPTGDGITAQ